MTVAQETLWSALERMADQPVTLGPAGDLRYELVELLDRGATAAVWRAHDRVLARSVAIKIFDDHSDAVALAIDEARAACEVQSDHVVRIHDAHRDADHAYIVMELVGEYSPTGDLVLGESAFACRPTGVREAARWVMQIARGIHDAHLRNVFHGDLNPRNVLVTPLSRRARIVDFGLAARRGGMSGTPAYMPPEHARRLGRGKPRRNELVAADVWGLGATAYDLLAGHAPWRGVDDLEPWEVAASGAAPAPLPRSVPRALRHIVERALALDPDARYATADALADDLAAFLANHPTSLERSRVQRMRLWCVRNPQVALTGLTATLLFALVLAAAARVIELRDEHAMLEGELAAQTTQRTDLAARVRAVRAELHQTEEELRAGHRDLERVRASLVDEREDYATVLRAKELALRRATAETRLLLGQLDELRGDRTVAETGRALYERYWTNARAERARVANERDDARAETEELRAQIEELRAEIEHLRAELARETAEKPEKPQQSKDPEKVGPPDPAPALESSADAHQTD